MVFALLFAVVAGVGASAAPMILNFDAPDDFYAGGRSYPAGKYEVEAKPGSSSLLLLRNREDQSVQGTVPVISRVAPKADLTGRVVFDQIDSRHTISGIYPPNGDGFLLAVARKPRPEK